MKDKLRFTAATQRAQAANRIVPSQLLTGGDHLQEAHSAAVGCLEGVVELLATQEFASWSPENRMRRLHGLPTVPPPVATVAEAAGGTQAARNTAPAASRTPQASAQLSSRNVDLYALV